MNNWDFASDLASVVTAIVAFTAYGKYQLDRCRRRWVLEKYLQAEKEEGSDKGQRSALNIMSKIGLTEAEIFEASRTSRNIVRLTKSGEDEFASKLLFKYERNGNSNLALPKI